MFQPGFSIKSLPALKSDLRYNKKQVRPFCIKSLEIVAVLLAHGLIKWQIIFTFINGEFL
jgi:hypothetical protein